MTGNTTARAASSFPGGGRIGEAVDRTGIAELTKLFWRRKVLLLAVFTVAFGVAVAVAFALTPLYTATARLIVNLQAAQALGDSLPGALKTIGMRAILLGEIEVLRSDRLTDRAVQQLGLLQDSEFNPAIAKPSPVEGWLDETIGTPLGENEQLRNASGARLTAKTLRERMTIRPPGISNVISISVTSRDPEKAARIANGFARIYIEDHLDRQVQMAMQARGFLEKRMHEIEGKALAAEQAVRDFIASHDQLDDGQVALADRQTNALGNQLAAAKAELAEKQVRYQQVVALAADSKTLATTKEVRNSALIQRLRDQEVQLVRKRAELDNRFGAKHPTMVNLNAELANIRTRIREEEQHIVEELKNEVDVAAARVKSLDKEAARMEEERSTVNRDKLQLRLLERDAEASRRLYEAFVSRAKLADQVVPTDRSQIEFISDAKPPFEPSFPRKGLILGFGFVMAVAAGLFVVLLVERLDSGFHTVSQLERVLNLPSLGVIPRPSASQRRSGPLPDIVVREGATAYAEAVRSLRTSLMVSRFDRPPKVVLIASSRSGEGKTSLAVSLARLSALSAVEGNVILIDGDLRRPGVAEMVGVPSERGLIHLFAGEVTFEQVVQVDPKTGLHILPATIGTPNPPELLNSHHMRSLLDELSESYDLIVLDSPPLDSVSDARVLARLADATVLVVEWEATPRNVAIESLKQLASAGAHIAGAVLQKVNLRRTASYGYDEA